MFVLDFRLLFFFNREQNKQQGTGFEVPTPPRRPRRPALLGVPRQRLARPLGLVAYPLLAALSPHFDPPRILAPDTRRLRLAAQRHAADGAVDAHALVLAAGLEALAAAVDDAVVLAAGAHHVWEESQSSGSTVCQRGSLTDCQVYL